MAIGSKMNSDSSLVPQAMVHALTSPQAKYRYRVGFDSKYIITPFTKIHESWQDAIWGAQAKVHPAKAPKDGKAVTKARYEGDPVPWYAAACVLALSGLRYLKVRSKM